MRRKPNGMRSIWLNSLRPATGSEFALTVKSESSDQSRISKSQKRWWTGRFSQLSHDYHLVDVTNPAGPTPLATIKQVRHKLVNEETGTTYLLGSDGLTVIRRPRIEEDYKTEQIQEEWN
jgi:hypothetical protein